MAHASHLPVSSHIPFFTMALIFCITAGVAGGWYFFSGESEPSLIAGTAGVPGPPVQDSILAKGSDTAADSAVEEVVMVVSDADQAREISHQIAQDDYLVASFGGSSAQIAVVVADQWVSETQLSELNATRAMLGEPALSVVYVD